MPRRELWPIPGADVASSSELVLRAAVAAYLDRHRGLTRQHCESDLRVFLRWCSDQHLDPLAAVRVDAFAGGGRCGSRSGVERGGVAGVAGVGGVVVASAAGGGAALRRSTRGE
jgi:hypothetical protein